ncbi:dihydroneopterin aldolase [Microbacterium oryzae]|uniref:7,8-dihydroneopterin aldolase n=1 Tax=Microbacterium oryzae TaxID=743009 RepID=A0A6I6E4X2_9MICO|nr:dihydroneopterin aldolase [Microbacterium oryzae]QGU27807.1 dihydroneopterin aldolase [Microbacterium oryzae]
MEALDRIELTGLTAFGRHGVFGFERENGQDFTIDLRLSLSTRRAAESDDVTDTVHYGELAEQVVAIVAGEPVNLIETLAHRIADAVLADERVRAVDVTVHKPHAPIAAQFSDVSVTVRRCALDATRGQDAR